MIAEVKDVRLARRVQLGSKEERSMKKALAMMIAVALGGCFATVDEQGRVVGEAGIRIGLPAVLPPLVVVEPGVSVVSDYDQEVFFSDGYYYTRRDSGWIRARDHRGSWARVEPTYVPAPIRQAPAGRYRHYRGEGHRGEHDDRR